MRIAIQTCSGNGQVLAVYIKVKDGKVARTVEIDEDAIFADENARGELLGVEMVAPGAVTLIGRVARKYHVKGMTKALRQAREALAI